MNFEHEIEKSARIYCEKHATISHYDLLEQLETDLRNIKSKANEIEKNIIKTRKALLAHLGIEIGMRFTTCKSARTFEIDNIRHGDITYINVYPVLKSGKKSVQHKQSFDLMRFISLLDSFTNIQQSPSLKI